MYVKRLAAALALLTGVAVIGLAPNLAQAVGALAITRVAPVSVWDSENYTPYLEYECKVEVDFSEPGESGASVYTLTSSTGKTYRGAEAEYETGALFFEVSCSDTPLGVPVEFTVHHGTTSSEPYTFTAQMTSHPSAVGINSTTINGKEYVLARTSNVVKFTGAWEAGAHLLVDVAATTASTPPKEQVLDYLLNSADGTLTFFVPDSALGKTLYISAKGYVDGKEFWLLRGKPVQVVNSFPTSSAPKAVPSKWVKKWPKKKGEAKSGRKVKVTAVKLSAAAKANHAAVAYAWKVGGKVVGHKKTLKLKKGWKRKKVSVAITVTAPGYKPKVRTIHFGKAA